MPSREAVITRFYVFSFNQPGIEPESTVLVAGALSTTEPKLVSSAEPRARSQKKTYFTDTANCWLTTYNAQSQ